VILAMLSFCLAPFAAWTEDAVEKKPDAMKPAPDAAKSEPKAEPKAEAQPGGGAEWQKLETKSVGLASPRQVLSPGYFDLSLQKMITFPKDGTAVDLGLPHAGKDSNGKDFPALLARLKDEFVWVDINGDGKPGGSETARINPDGLSDPITCDLHYEDGTTAQYSFRFKTIAEKEKFAIVRTMARTATFQNHKITLLDDDGNGKYDDVDRDALVIDDQPVTFLGKYILIGEDFYEVVAHPAGTVMEIRAAPKIDTGIADMFAAYTVSQKSETMKIHGLIITGPNGSFSFDERRKAGKVPAGTYDITFGLFERAKETVYMKKGEKTSFSVVARETAKPKWGGEVTAKFDLSSDGEKVTVGIPTFMGEGSETYYPENYRAVGVLAIISQVFVDRMRIERLSGFGQKKFEVQPDGSIKPVEFRYMRNANDQYEVAIEYNSGIMGKVVGKERMQFVFKKKDPKDKDKDAKEKK
jgi:hypothetical protein